MLFSAIEHHAQTHGSRPILHVQEASQWETMTPSSLLADVERWAAMFTARGFQRNSVVFIVLQHGARLYPAFLGAMRAGLIPSLLPFPTPKQDRVLYWESHLLLFERVEPSCIVTYGENVAPLRAVVADMTCPIVDADRLTFGEDAVLPLLEDIESEPAVALLQHSSGTTGLKKGVALTFGQIERQVSAYAQAIDASGNDCIATWLPLYHDMGLVTGFLLPLTLGCRIVSIGAFDWLARPDQLLRLIGTHKATFCWLPNFAFNHLLRTRDKKGAYDLASMRAFISCSEPCRADTMERFRSVFIPHGLRADALQVCYAMAETVFAVTQTASGTLPRMLSIDQARFASDRLVAPVAEADSNAARFVSCGHVIEGLQIRICPASPGEQAGEVQIRGEFLFASYYRNEDETRSAFEDGWYKTGDIGFLDRGELFISGRIKELLIVHGRNFYANDIEAIVSHVPGVKPGRAVVFGVADGTTGSEEAVVLAEPDTAGDDGLHLEKRIKQAVFDRLELSLKRVVIVPSGRIIKTTSGKINRKDNARVYLEEFAPAP